MCGGDIYELHFRIVMGTCCIRSNGFDGVRFTDLDVSCNRQMHLCLDGKLKTNVFPIY